MPIASHRAEEIRLNTLAALEQVQKALRSVQTEDDLAEILHAIKGMAESMESCTSRLTPLTGLETSLEITMRRLSRLAGKADPIRRT